LALTILEYKKPASLFFRRRGLKSRSGFSVMEMLLAISLFSIVLIFSIASFQKADQAIENQNIVSHRQRLFFNLINAFGMPASVRASVEVNGETSALWKCVRGFQCTPDIRQDITLYMPPLFSNGSSVTVSGPISGPPDAPLLYSLKGIPCLPSAGSTCSPDKYPIAVSTQFQAICPPKYDIHAKGNVWSGPIYPDGLIPITGEDCLRAHYLRIFYKFELVGGSPKIAHFRTVQGSVMVNSVSVNLSR